MSFTKPAKGVIFANEKLEQEFNSLPEDDWLKKAIKRAINDFKENVFCGERIKKERIPRDYNQRYGINNLLWYPLPNAWRLVYSILTPNNNEIFAIIVDYSDHKDYERKFGY